MRLFPLSGDDTALVSGDPIKRAEINAFKNIIGQASRSYGGTVSTFPGRLELTDLAATRTIMTKLGIGAKPSDLQTLFAGAGQWGASIARAIAARADAGKIQDTWTPAQQAPAVAPETKPPVAAPKSNLPLILGVTAGVGALIWFTMFRK